jgi:spermidine synthase
MSPDGEPVTLSLEGEGHVVRVRNQVLMTARLNGSEQAMAQLALPEARVPASRRVLVGGLGMGFTLRAVLDRAAADCVVDVVELLPEVLEWNWRWLAPLAGAPLQDPRVTAIQADLLDHLCALTEGYDAILLDIDNGPEAFTVAGNQRLYDAGGIAALAKAMNPGATLVLWSAFRDDAFEERLCRAGLHARSVTARARGAVRKGARHTLFVGEKAARPGRPDRHPPPEPASADNAGSRQRVSHRGGTP